ncbi:MAG: chorismate pyruvate-lyase family protein [Solirubrobacterales bacterium]
MASDLLTTLDFTSSEPADFGANSLDIATLGPALRGVLFTDGTVTRALEVQTLARISVDVVSQCDAPVPEAAASRLDVPHGAPSIKRQIAMRFGGDREEASVWAESFILAERLPPGFVRRLTGAQHGIGESLQSLKVESWRDLLWCQLGRRPEWGTHGERAGDLAITRLYRVVTGGKPALLISECFAVEARGEGYELVAQRG